MNKKNLDSQNLDAVLAEIEKNFGKGSVMKLGDRPQIDTDVIPSGSLLLNNALGIGGYPKGRIIEIYGPESSGKTTLALHAIAEAQKKGGRAAFVDAEHSIDPQYAKNLGVNINELILSQPDYGEQALEIVEKLVNSGAFNIIVVDSVAALVPQAELEGEMIDSTVGLQARLMSKALRKLAGAMNQNECTVIFINQLRDKVCVMYGNTVNIKVVKNKVAPPYKNCLIDIIYGKGISHEGELLDLGLQYEVLSRAGAWYEYDGTRFANGKEAGKAYLETHPEMAQEIEDKIKKAIAKQD